MIELTTTERGTGQHRESNISVRKLTREVSVVVVARSLERLRSEEIDTHTDLKSVVDAVGKSTEKSTRGRRIGEGKCTR